MLSLLFLLLIPNPVRAAEVTVLGGVNYAAPTELLSGTDQHWTGNAGAWGGILGALPFSDLPLSFETGILIRSTRSEQNAPSGLITRSGEWTDLPLLIHYHFDPSISLGVGGFWSFFRSGNAIPASESPDSGLMLDLRGRIPAGPVTLILDARYLHGLSNLAAQPGDTFNSRTVGFMAGACFQIF